MRKVPFGAVLVSLLAMVALGAVISVTPINENSSTSKSLAKLPSADQVACETTGITLVVDFGDDQSGVQEYCVDDFTGSGWQLLKAAGLEILGTAEYPESFLCRINNVPASDVEDCLGTPSLSKGTWVYFVASASQAGGSWIRSGMGAAARNPECGDVDGWRFVTSTSDANSPPRIEPKPFTCESK